MRIRRPILLGLLALGVVITAGVFWFRQSVDARWEAMAAAADELERCLDAVDGSRPVLFGEAVAGDAWDDYARALELLPRDSGDRWLDIVVARNKGELERERELRDAFVTAHLAALRAVRTGTHRARAKLRIDWSRGYSRRMANLLTTRSLANACVLAAERHLDRGEPDRAVDVLLDGMQFARDFAQIPTVVEEMIGIALLAITGKGSLVDRGLLARLPEGALRRLDAGMRILDEGFPVASLTRHGELLLFARTAQRPGQMRRLTGGSLSWLDTWRFGFCPRLMCAMSFEDRLAHVETMQANSGEPWPARRALAEAGARRLEDSGNMMNDPARCLDSAELSVRGVIAQFRMARMAVDHRLRGRCTPLPDPFGGTIAWKIEDDVLRLMAKDEAGMAPVAVPLK